MEESTARLTCSHFVSRSGEVPDFLTTSKELLAAVPGKEPRTRISVLSKIVHCVCRSTGFGEVFNESPGGLRTASSPKVQWCVEQVSGILMWNLSKRKDTPDLLKVCWQCDNFWGNWKRKWWELWGMQYMKGNIDRLEKKLKRISMGLTKSIRVVDFHYEQTGRRVQRELKDEKRTKHRPFCTGRSGRN